MTGTTINFLCFIGGFITGEIVVLLGLALVYLSDR